MERRVRSMVAHMEIYRLGSIGEQRKSAGFLRTRTRAFASRRACSSTMRGGSAGPASARRGDVPGPAMICFATACRVMGTAPL
jgi:hypothetical protein